MLVVRPRRDRGLFVLERIAMEEADAAEEEQRAARARKVRPQAVLYDAAQRACAAQ